AGPLAATPIATDLPDRVMRPPLRQRGARCARGVILPAHGKGRQARTAAFVPVITAEGCRIAHVRVVGAAPSARRTAPSGLVEQLGAALPVAFEPLLAPPGARHPAAAGPQARGRTA